MELKWLEDFLAVAKTRNFSQACVARHMTQSALSRRIKALEMWYGVPLIDRSSYPVTLTQEGTAFLSLAEQIVADLYRSRREAAASREAAGRTLRFAMPHSLAVCFFPTWWRAQRQVSEPRASVIAADLDECVELLLSGACQFVLCYCHPRIPNLLAASSFRGVRVGETTLVPVSAVDASGEPCFPLPPRDGQPVPLLAYSNESFLGRVTGTLHAELEAHFPLVLRYESALVEALKMEALLGEGVAWLPEGMIESELRAGTLAVVGDADSTAQLEIWLFASNTSTLSGVGSELAFVRQLRRVDIAADE
ncbi:MAG: LysR family transcriptional regulator [Pandoraea sp.]|nr:LysR family transcriptional regulator [Pandoraea sp.]MDR3398180.1 LysR family transcriptional regulator [Pandoraea sp.]